MWVWLSSKIFDYTFSRMSSNIHWIEEYINGVSGVLWGFKEFFFSAFHNYSMTQIHSSQHRRTKRPITPTASSSDSVTLQELVDLATSSEVPNNVLTAPPNNAYPTDNGDDLRSMQSTLHRSKLFLGNPNLLGEVEWVESGRQRILVLKNTEEDALREFAVLEWVGEISPINFWLYPCAGWSGERGPHGDWEKGTPFEKAKARASIMSPPFDPFNGDWGACIDNIQKLMNSLINVGGAKIGTSILQQGEIRIRHAVFEVQSR
jgi:hypothetical protein